MNTLDHALALAADGFYVFPLQAGKKVPPRGMHFKEQATRDAGAIRRWFENEGSNVGIYTGRFAENEALLVLDLDLKGKRNGNRDLLRFEMEGLDVPVTREHHTPTGGRHLFYRVPGPVNQRKLADGIDTRSLGGYVVGSGSVVGGKPYVVARGSAVNPAPVWIVDRLGRASDRTGEQAAAPDFQLDAGRAVSRGTDYLLSEAPLAVSGQGGDAVTYTVAARVKDFGVSAEEAVLLLTEHWNPRCSPPWDIDELRTKVHNAYAYGNKPIGSSAPEAELAPVPAPKPEAAPASGDKHPFERLNQEFAFVIAGGGSHILWETKDANDQDVIEHLNTGTFHAKFAASKIQVGKKSSPITEEWMQWDGRRSYDGLVFMPLQDAPKRFYNLWRGFAVEPWPADVPPSADAQWAVEAWMSHIRENVARGHEVQARWLIDFFAHLIQRPWDKPLVAPVLRGGKGVGKNATFAPVSHLLGMHAMTTAKRRYLVGNFNGHLEKLLLFVLDEAFWSGDKQAEGELKDLITGDHHAIEHKGKEQFKIANRTRIAILGNEDWLVPATHDERRFAVYDVGDGRKQDGAFFRTMKEKMAAGGHAYLLRCLKELPIRSDLNTAPATSGLLDQKHASLEPFHQWWLESLKEGALIGGEFTDAWTKDVARDRFRNAFGRYVKERQIKSRLLDYSAIDKQLAAICPESGRGQTRTDGRIYKLPDLATARAGWDAFIGHKVEWTER